MRTVFMAQWAKDRRNPLLILLFIVLSVAASLLFTSGSQGPTSIAIFSEEGNAEEIVAKWEEVLNQQGAYYHFKVVDAERAREHVRSGQSDVAVRLMLEDYRIVAANDSPTIQRVEQYVHKVFTQELHIQAHAGSDKSQELREELNAYKLNPPFQLAKQELDGSEVANYNMGTQLLFAFTLLIVMFTIGFKVNGVTNDKVSGIWNRLILSPITKTSMYLGYITYSFCISFFQIVVVLVLFKYVLKYDLGNQFGLVIGITAVFIFSMISLAMLITGFITKPEQFYAIYPSFIPLIPLISGSYMMPGTMDHPVLTFIADLFPMSHAMEAIMDVVNYDAGLMDIVLPVSLMLLIGVVYMGIGINLVERRKSS